MHRFNSDSAKDSDARSLRTMFVVNPTAAAGATRSRWQVIEAEARRHLNDYEVVMTRHGGHATTLTRGALQAGFQQVVAVGGDGTINEVVNGFFAEGEPIAPQAVFAIIAQGTGCDFVKTLYPDDDLPRACARLAGHATRLVDVGHVRCRDYEGNTVQRVFINVLSFGIGGEVARRMGCSKLLGGRLGYKLVSARTLLTYRDRHVRVRTDDGAWQKLAITHFAVANARYHGGGMMVAPTASLGDGLFQITCWQGFGLLDFLLRQHKLYDGSHVDLNGCTQYQGSKLWAESEQRVLIEIDGEPVGELPLAVQILPAALRVKA